MTQHDVDLDSLVSDHAVLDAMPGAIVVTDPSGVILRWNHGAQELYGWLGHEVIGRNVRDVLVTVQDRAAGDSIMDQVREGTGWQGDFMVAHKDGELIRVEIVNRPITSADGTVVALLGAARDVTDRRQLEAQAQDLSDRLRLALDAGGLGTWRWEMRTGRTEWDSPMEQLFGLDPGTFDGTFDAWVGMIHPDDVAETMAVLDEAVRTRSEYVVEHRVIWPDGTVHWLHGSGGVTIDPQGTVTGTIGCNMDVTERVEAELERERLMQQAVEAAAADRVHRERIEFLAQVSEELALAENHHELVARVVAAAVPRLGDWCSMHLLTPGSAELQVEVAHVDPEMVAYARELQERFPYDPAAPTGVAAVIRTGRAEFYPDITAEILDDLNLTTEEREILRRLAFRSAIVVPLKKNGRILGAMQFVMTESSRRYTHDDLALASAVADRISSSLEFRRISEQQTRIARTLQASLLPAELPTISGLEVAVRYWAAGDGVEVGGDFYDLFDIAPGRRAVVIGDVCGTGPGAAAATGLARHTLASAACRGDQPEEVLRHLNDMLRKRRTASFLTAIYGELRERATGYDLLLSCAGHPLPIHVRDGLASPCAESGTLLGVLDDLALTVSTTELRPGDTVVLYTDGATDVPHPYGLDAIGMARLVGGAASAATAEGVADGIYERLAQILPFEQRDDDIAMLVLRVPALADTNACAEGEPADLLGPPLVPAPKHDSVVIRSTADLVALRDHLVAFCGRANVDQQRREDVILVVSEMAANSLRHAPGSGTVRTWDDGAHLCIQADDDGLIQDPLVGRRRPAPSSPSGRGLWLAHQLADLVELRSGPAGTSVRVTFDR